MATVLLKAQICVLAAEGRVTRRHEAKFRGEKWHNDIARVILTNHRHAVRSRARAALLAYAFLRGRAFEQLEAKSYSPPPLDDALTLLSIHGTGTAKERKQFDSWSKRARKWKHPDVKKPTATATNYSRAREGFLKRVDEFVRDPDRMTRETNKNFFVLVNEFATEAASLGFDFRKLTAERGSLFDRGRFQLFLAGEVAPSRELIAEGVKERLRDKLVNDGVLLNRIEQYLQRFAR